MAKKILVVDDDIDFLEQMEAQLQAAGFEVITADGRKKAEEIIEQTRPDLAIVDLMMEDMDGGFVLSYHLKKKYPDVPIILATAVAGATGLKFDAVTPEERSWVKADAIIDKPVRFEQLKREIERLLKG